MIFDGIVQRDQEVEMTTATAPTVLDRRWPEEGVTRVPFWASPFNMGIVGRLIEPSRHGCHSCTLFLLVVSFLDHEDVYGMPRD
jgi:hypothetical protein